MARGKQTCKILKEIRRQIAEANNIEFVTSECRYKGNCLGTCPKCEAELRYLEQELRARQLMGKAVVLAGLSAGMLALSGCSCSQLHSSEDARELQGEPIEMTGDIALPEGEEIPESKFGEIPEPDEVNDTIYTEEDEAPVFPGEGEN